MDAFIKSPLGAFAGSLILLVAGLLGGMGFFYFAAVGLIWGIVWSKLANQEDYLD